MTPWAVARQAPLSMGFPRHEYWSGLPFPSPGNLPNLGIEHSSPALADGFFTTEPLAKPLFSPGIRDANYCYNGNHMIICKCIKLATLYTLNLHNVMSNIIK